MQNQLPEEFLRRLTQVVPEDKITEVTESFCQPKKLSIRTNTLKITAIELHQKLTAEGVKLNTVPCWEDAFVVDYSPHHLTETQAYKDGLFYIQSLSSMLPALVLYPQANEKVLDICAAPGSKTTQLSTLMHNSGEIVANDISRARMYKLEANLQSQGVANVHTSLLAAERIWEKYPEYFDKTLVDVPCSMEGRFKCDDPETFVDWSPKKVKELGKRQRWILRSAVSATKSGGTIVYSTCTLSREENEDVINWIVAKDGHKLELEDISLPGSPLASGLIPHTYRVWPDTLYEGFFITKLRKL